MYTANFMNEMPTKFFKVTLRILHNLLACRCHSFVLVALVVLTYTELRADYLVLTSGEKITCAVLEETDTGYRIERNGIETTIPKTRVQSVQRLPKSSEPVASRPVNLMESGLPVLFLSELFPSFAEQAWGELHFDASVENHPLRIGGRYFPRGLGTHANSSLTFAINGQARRFRAAVGIDDEVRESGSPQDADVRFLVYGDARLLYSSKAMRAGSAPEEIDIPLDGIRELTLRVDDLGREACDHADWANARLLVSSSDACATLRHEAAAAWSQAAVKEHPLVCLKPPVSTLGAHLAYKIRITNPASGMFDVVLTVRDLSQPALDLRTCRDLGQIETVTAISPTSQVLTVLHTDDGKWKISETNFPTITVNYQVNARVRDPEHAQPVYPMDLNKSGGCIDGWTTFLYPENSPIASITVTCELPKGWRMVTPWYETEEGLRCDPVYPRRHLTDAVCVIGQYQEVRQKFGAMEFVVTYPLKDPNASVKESIPPDDASGDVQNCLKICEYFQREFNGFPFEKYAILLTPKNVRGIGSSAYPSGFIVPEHRKLANPSWLAHEICHAAAIGGDEWCNEGMAMYYDALVPDTLGLTNARLRQRIAGDFKKLKTLHAEGKDRSVAQMSQTGEAKKLHWTTGDPSLVWFTYNKAAMIFFIIDQRLRILSDDQRSLADLVRHIKTRKLRPNNYNLVHTLNQVCAEIDPFHNFPYETPGSSGWNWSGFFHAYVLGDALLPISGYQLFCEAREHLAKGNVEEARRSFKQARAAFLENEYSAEANACTRWIQRCGSTSQHTTAPR